jgi:ArsR family transcriptional regulator, arsenate/arsenite/antimonite-responsive transcriptional repressor
MEVSAAARCLEALGSAHRLGIYRLLVEAGPDGMNVGDIRQRLDMPASTLSHHISKLVQHGLVSQERMSRNLNCCCNYVAMEELVLFLTQNCCSGARSGCDQP